MDRRAVIVASAVSVALGTLAGTSFGRSPSGLACPTERAAPVTTDSRVARGQGLPAIIGRSIVTLEIGSRRQAFVAPSDPDSVLRHIASRPGVGTAYVEDHRGPDTVVIVDRHGVTKLPQAGEATQPSWSSDGRLVWSTGSALALWSRSAGSTTRITAPHGAVGVFSPIFIDRDHITAVVSERVGGIRLEDEGLNDLFRYDLRSRSWTRLTRFRASRDQWFAIRTPIRMPGGVLQFVGVSGSASATVKPTSSLWELSGRAVRKLRDLTGERYLAGTLDGRRVWNVFDSTLGDWRLTAETASGPIDLGCGRTMVDPRAEPDPDRGPIAPSPASTPAPTASTTPTDSPTATATPAATTTASPSPTIAPIVGPTEGILVGDLGSPEAADAVAAAIEAAYGGRTDVEVVDNASAPWLIQPGAWAAVMRLSPDQDPVASWLSFRDRLPQFAGMCWVVAL